MVSSAGGGGALERASREAAVRRPLHDDVDVAGVLPPADPALAEGEQGAGGGDDRRDPKACTDWGTAGVGAPHSGGRLVNDGVVVRPACPARATSGGTPGPECPVAAGCGAWMPCGSRCCVRCSPGRSGWGPRGGSRGRCGDPWCRTAVGYCSSVRPSTSRGTSRPTWSTRRPGPVRRNSRPRSSGMTASDPAHLAVGLGRVSAARRGETHLAVAPSEPGAALLERVHDARRAGVRCSRWTPVTGSLECWPTRRWRRPPCPRSTWTRCSIWSPRPPGRTCCRRRGGDGVFGTASPVSPAG